MHFTSLLMQSNFIEILKIRLSKPLPGKNAQFLMAPSFRIDINDDENPEIAGVMLLLYQKQEKWATAFMKRTEYKGVHSGQISFPGGKYEKSDHDILATALRETEEEFGIASSEITILGKLTPLHIPVSKIDVHPFIAYIEKSPKFILDPTEVQYLIEVSVADLLAPETKESKPYKSSKYEGVIPYYNVKGDHIWGATAMILSEFIEIVKDLE